MTEQRARELQQIGTDYLREMGSEYAQFQSAIIRQTIRIAPTTPAEQMIHRFLTGVPALREDHHVR